MTEGYRDIVCWVRAACVPSRREFIALSAMLGLWWGGQRQMIVPHWEHITHQIRQTAAQYHHIQQVHAAAQRIPIKGRLIAAAEETLEQACRDEAARLGADVVALAWHADEATLTVSLRGDSQVLLAWWDNLGRSSLLASVQQWQLQPVMSEERGAENGAFQLEVVLCPERWRWEAYSSS